MARVADIERLKALVDRLLPLASRARGEVIAADDWNTVVGALLEVARAVVEDDADAAIPEHAHPDQVAVGWLDPRLRTLIERGPLSDPTSTSRVSAIERQAGLIGRQLDEVSNQLRDLRVVTNRQETNDLDRSSSLTVLSRTVAGLKDPRDEVAALRASLDAIGANVSAVSTFAAGLGDVTPADVLSGLRRIDQLQERLTTPTGTLLDAGEFERRLTELRTTLVTEDELTEAIKSRPARLTNEAKAQLLDEAKLAAVRQAEDSATTLNEALRNQLTTRIDEVAQSAVQAARQAAGDFRDELKTAITEQMTQVVEQGQRATEDRMKERVDDVKVALQAVVDERITRFEGRVDDRVSAAITASKPSLMAELNATLDNRLSGLDGKLVTLQGGLVDIRTALTSAATEVATVRQSTATALANQAAALRAELAGQQSRFDVALADVRRQIPPASQGITREELLTELARNNDKLRSEVQTTITSGVETQLDHRLTGHLQVIDTEGISPMLHLQAGQHVVLRPVRPDQPFG
jgi:hypothetical protein